MSNYFDATGTIGFTCDRCGREMQGCTWVNGMKFCANCYQETFGNNTSQFVDLLNKEIYELKIANLETKLAESEKNIEELKGERLSIYTDNFKNTQVINGVHFTTEQLIVVGEYIQYLKNTNLEFEKQNKELKQQLAEKEKELENITESARVVIHSHIEFTEKINQHKIEFAIEQLEHLRNTIDNEIYYCYGDNNINIVINKNKFNELFDNQINELKGWK